MFVLVRAIKDKCHDGLSKFSISTVDIIGDENSCQYQHVVEINGKIYQRVFIPRALTTEQFIKIGRIQRNRIKNSSGFGISLYDDGCPFSMFLDNYSNDPEQIINLFDEIDFSELMEQIDIVLTFLQSLLILDMERKYLKKIQEIIQMCSHTKIAMTVTDIVIDSLSLNHQNNLIQNMLSKDIFEVICQKRGYNTCFIRKSHLLGLLKLVIDRIKMRMEPNVLMANWCKFMNMGLSYNIFSDDGVMSNGRLIMTHHNIPLFSSVLHHDICVNITGSVGSVLATYISSIYSCFIGSHPNVIILNDKQLSSESHMAKKQLQWRRLKDDDLSPFRIANKYKNMYMFSVAEIKQTLMTDSFEDQGGCFLRLVKRRNGKKKWFENVLKENLILAPVWICMSEKEYSTICKYVETVFESNPALHDNDISNDKDTCTFPYKDVCFVTNHYESDDYFISKSTNRRRSPLTSSSLSGVGRKTSAIKSRRGKNSSSSSPLLLCDVENNIQKVFGELKFNILSEMAFVHSYPNYYLGDRNNKKPLPDWIKELTEAAMNFVCRIDINSKRILASLKKKRGKKPVKAESDRDNNVVDKKNVQKRKREVTTKDESSCDFEMSANKKKRKNVMEESTKTDTEVVGGGGGGKELINIIKMEHGNYLNLDRTSNEGERRKSPRLDISKEKIPMEMDNENNNKSKKKKFKKWRGTYKYWQ